MPRSAFPRFLRLSLFVGTMGWLSAATALSGCPGELDPSLTGQGTGTGGSMGTGGGTGTGGSNASCTGDNDGAKIVMTKCASSACHVPGGVNGGLDLTVDSNIKSRLVGVKSPGTNGSSCGTNQTPYLNANSSPATGLLIDKVKSPPPCGFQMPFGGDPLSAAQQDCLVQWATTLTSP